MKAGKRMAAIAATAILGMMAAALVMGPIVEAYSRGSRVKVIYSGSYHDWDKLQKAICGLASATRDGRARRQLHRHGEVRQLRSHQQRPRSRAWSVRPAQPSIRKPTTAK